MSNSKMVDQQGLWATVSNPEKKIKEIFTDIMGSTTANIETKVSETIKNLFKFGGKPIEIGLSSNYTTLTEIVLTLISIFRCKDWIATSCIIINFLIRQKISVTMAEELVRYMGSMFEEKKNLDQQGAIPPSSPSLYSRVVEIWFLFLHTISFKKIPGKKTIMDFCRDAHFISMGINGVKNITSFISSFFSYYTNWLWKTITGSSWNKEYDELKELLACIPDLNKRMYEDKDHRALRKELTKRIETAMRLQVLAYSAGFKVQFDTLMVSLRILSSKVDTALAKVDLKTPL